MKLDKITEIPKRRGAAELASDLRKAITDENFAHAERLPSERVLSEQFGVSRGTVRDALMRLEADGLVEIRAGSGTYVTYSHTDNGAEIIQNARPLELIDTRFALEPHICRLVVLHGQERDFQALEALLEEMETLVDTPRKFAEVDTRFHAQLADATGNSLLIWIISQINDVRGQDQWDQMRKVTLEPQIIQTYNTQHRLIVEAIRNRDPERAAMLMKDHLETARRSLMRSAEA